MSDALIGAIASIVVGGLSFLGVVISNNRSNNKMQNDMKISQAVSDERIEELTREVRKHNGFAERVPVLEEQMKMTNKRLVKLESFHTPKE